jgi:hypothetical protein
MSNILGFFLYSERVEHSDSGGDETKERKERIEDHPTIEIFIILDYAESHDRDIERQSQSKVLLGTQYSPLTTGPANPRITGPKLVKAVVPIPTLMSKFSLSANA